MQNEFSPGYDGFKETAAARDAREAAERKTRERQREVQWKKDRDQQEKELRIRLENGAYIIRDDRTGRPLRTRENAIREDLLAREIDRRIARDPSQSSMSIKTQLCREVEEKNGRVSGGVAQQLVDEGHLKQYRDDRERQRQIDAMREQERNKDRGDDLERGR